MSQSQSFSLSAFRAGAGLVLTLFVAPSLMGCGGTPTSVSLHDSKPTAEEMAACAKWDLMNQSISKSYWKPGTFEEPLDEARRNWYSAQLCAMGEAPLSAPPKGRSRIRFLWLRSFNPGISVRVEFDLDSAELFATKLDGAGGYAPGNVAQHVKRALLPEDWTKVQQALAESDFWNLQTNEQSLGLDGARWIVEVAEYDRDHVVDRWSGGEVESIGRMLLDLSQLEPDPIY